MIEMRLWSLINGDFLTVLTSYFFLLMPVTMKGIKSLFLTQHKMNIRELMFLYVLKNCPLIYIVSFIVEDLYVCISTQR